MSLQGTESIAAILIPRGHNSDVEVRIARSAVEVESLREPWTKWSGHRDSDIDFVLMIIESYPEARRPHVIALYRDGKPEAILIGRLEEKRLAFKIGYLNVFRARARCLTFVYGALRGNASRENAEILVQQVVNCLKQGEADVAALEFVQVDSSLHKLARKLPSILSRDILPLWQKHDIMMVPDSIEEVYRRMSGTRRKHLKSSIKRLKLQPAGSTLLICYCNVRELDQLFCDVEEIAKKTYQRGLGAGFSDTQIVRRRLELAARSGWLRANVLYLGNHPVAFWIGMLYRGTFVSEYMGYDPEFRQFSPGMVLIMRVIEGFCSHANGDDVKELDFGLGHAEYKAVLCTKSWVEGSVFIFGPGARGLLLKLLRTSTRMADGTARKILACTTYFARVKRWWRDRLSKQASKSPSLPGKSEHCAAADR